MVYRTRTSSLPAKRSLSLKISLFCLVCLFSAGCKDEIWEIPVVEVKTRLQFSDFTFLRHLEIKKERLSELFRLAPEAPFYFYYIFQELGRPDLAVESRRLQWKRGKGIWKEEAGLSILRKSLATGDYADAEQLCRNFIPRLKDDGHRLQAERVLLEALYWQHQDEEVLQRLNDYPILEGKKDPELVLFAAVANSRLDRPAWPERFLKLFFTEKASVLHLRALSFLELDERHTKFQPPEYAVFRAKALLYQGKRKEAVRILEENLPLLDLELLNAPLIFFELTSAYLGLETYQQGARFFQSLTRSDVTRLDGHRSDVHLSARAENLSLEMAARLLRKAGNGESLLRAEDLFLQVIQSIVSMSTPGVMPAPFPQSGTTPMSGAVAGVPSAASGGGVSDLELEQLDRCLWFYLDLHKGGEDFLQVVEEMSSLWQSPGYFADLLDEEITRLLARRQWTSLAALYRFIEGTGPESILARLIYILGRGVDLGLLPGEELDSAVLYRASRALKPDGYLALLASTLLEEAHELPQGLYSKTGEQGTLPDQEQLILGFFEFGLPLEGYRRLIDSDRDWSDGLVLEAAAWLNRRGHFIESIRLMNRYNGSPTRKSLMLAYPRAFLLDIEETARNEELDADLLFALVREESHFDAGIVSRAGATGLTQLMPETAEDMARILRLKGADLKDPRHNLELGGRHLSRLMGRLESVPKTLMAYNAGLARVRVWERQFAGLPVDLMVEALPYKETRGYVHKVLVSNVYYNYLYWKRAPGDTVCRYFPNLKGCQG